MKNIAVAKELGVCIVSPQSIRHDEGQCLHRFSNHQPLWDFEHTRNKAPFVKGSKTAPLFDTLPKGTDIAEALRATKLVCFIGACPSEALDLARKTEGAACLVFEPDIEKLEAYLGSFKARTHLSNRTIYFAGDPRHLSQSIAAILPDTFADVGFPVFFIQDGLENLEVNDHIIKQIELHFYRNRIYYISGRDHYKGFPLRPMLRNLTYDCTYHAYGSLSLCLNSGTLSDLKDKFCGTSAILIAAGPGLTEKIDWIKSQQENAVTIAVNNALPPLLCNGFHPDFVVINDTSRVAGRSLDQLPESVKSSLVGHCLCRLTQDPFANLFVFGNYEGQPFPLRDSLLLHGSVITTAFALAEYMGCNRAYLVGAQLASSHPFKLSYARGTAHGEVDDHWHPSQLPNRFPQLYPVTAADGSTMFTTLNFFDSSQWLIERIHGSSVEVINTAPDSIIYSDRIKVDQNPTIPQSPLIKEQRDGIAMSTPGGNHERVRSYIRQQIDYWRNSLKQASALLSLLKEPSDNDILLALHYIAECDKDNRSFMLTQYDTYDNETFHNLMISTNDLAGPRNGAEYFLKCLCEMSNDLFRLLLDQLMKVNREARGSRTD